VEQVYDEETAIEQAERCLQCHVETIYDPNLCVLCGACVDICPEYCLLLVPFAEIEVENYDAGNIRERFAGGEDFSVMLKDHDRCIRCGLCAKICPTDVSAAVCARRSVPRTPGRWRDLIIRI